jgi:hypothetical protein
MYAKRETPEGIEQKGEVVKVEIKKTLRDGTVIIIRRAI